MFTLNNHTSKLQLSLLSVLFVFIAGCNNGDNSSRDTDSQTASVNITEEQSETTDKLPTVTQRVSVHKSPTCGCCQKWVDYLEEEGFSVDVHNHEDLNPIKRSLGMNQPNLYSCHTAVIGDYLIEGHVPVSDIRRLLSEKPKIAGLSAPGMPMMSPGMNSRTPKDYAVLSFTDSGETTVYSQY